MCYKTYFNVVFVNSDMGHVPFKYLEHFAEWFPACTEGYREGKHKLTRLEDVVVIYAYVAIFF